jgi:FkbM family methyltransferase
MKTAGEIVDGKGTYQIKKLRAAVAQCTQKRVALDVGGHCGLWSMQLVKQFGHVHAFEPVAAHRACFVKNVTTDNVTLHAVALGAAPGSISMHTAPTSSGDSWVSGVGDIPMVVLDSFGFFNVDFIKIDVEGSELSVLRGGEDTIKRCKPIIIVEQKPGHAQRFGFGETAAVPYLISLGYRCVKELSGDFIMTPEVIA